MRPPYILFECISAIVKQVKMLIRNIMYNAEHPSVYILGNMPNVYRLHHCVAFVKQYTS